MNSHTDQVELTPAQIDFCAKHITGFAMDSWRISLAGKAGSDRVFLRLSPVPDCGRSYVLVLWNSRDSDWERFIRIQEEVSRSIQLLPAIYAVDAAHGLILEEDCGRRRLKDFCLATHDRGEVEAMYRRVCDALVTWQQIPPAQCPVLSSRVLDKDMFLWETDYFSTHCVGEYFGLDALLNGEWERERHTLAEEAAALPLVCLHRDFQSENIMIHTDGIKFVDYQGARQGAAGYDVASLLFDPYVSCLDEKLRYRLLDYYIQRSGRNVSRYSFHIAAIQRLAQALGAYGNLSLHKGKDVYRAYIPVALSLLLQVLEQEHIFPRFTTIVSECRQRTY